MSGKLSYVRFMLLFTFALGAETAVTRLSLKQNRVDVSGCG